MKNINKLTKEEKEALDKLSEKQVFLLMKKVTKEYLSNKEELSKGERLIKLRDYFFKKDVYHAYNSLNGILNSIDNERISLLFEKDTLNINNKLLSVEYMASEFMSNLYLLEMVLSIAYSESESSESLQKKLNLLIKAIYYETLSLYQDSKFLVKLIKEHQKKIANNHESIKEILKENQEIKVDNSIFKEFEFNLEILVDNIDKYEKGFKEFEELSEDGFVFIKKEDRSSKKSNLIYDFNSFSIKCKA